MNNAGAQMSKISLNADNLLNPQTNKEPLRLEDLENRIINADCMDILKQLPDKCVDLVLTDPPYGIGCDGGNYGLGVKPKDFKKKNWDNEIPNKDVFDEIKRVSKNQIIFGGNYFTDYLKSTKSWIFWDKKGDLRVQNNFSDGELIWTSFNNVTKKITYIQQGFLNQNKGENLDRIHPTQKPVDLIGQILRDYSNENDLILDCFSGSGTTAIACHRLNRRFICIEKDKEYWEASCKRLEDERKQYHYSEAINDRMGCDIQ
jgi:site-specific DNA-methyltransferase (adenine-specific)